MPFYEKGDVRIRYEMVGSGFPLLATPGGGLNSRVSNWPTAVFNAMDAFKDDFRCITMDQRNANGGESTGPIPSGPRARHVPARRACQGVRRRIRRARRRRR
jgi:pimeloyl-ACP methyl ester carboxylesterase